MSERLDKAFAAAKYALQSSYLGTAWTPVIIAYSPARPVIIAMPFRDDYEKSLFIAMTREQMKQIEGHPFRRDDRGLDCGRPRGEPRLNP